MRLAQVVHSHDVGDWFYEAVPDFLARYDRVMTEWRGHLVDRPSFKRPDHGTASHKRAREVVLFICQKFHDKLVYN